MRMLRVSSEARKGRAWIATVLRLVLAATASLILVLVPRAALAQQPAPAKPAAPAPQTPAPSEASWAGEIEGLTRWLDQRRATPACTERCFVLDRLRITGALGDGPLAFELTGGVLARGSASVPLFGPPAHVRIDGATIDGKDAAVGFEGDHYFVFTDARRFVLKGTLTLEGDLTLVLPGPLNALEVDITGGTLAEGTRLSGLTAATVHFAREGTGAEKAGPTVFQLSRAIRVGREIAFEYRLVMRSGTDLGVVRLPLAFGEKVLDVTGSTGFRVEGEELVLPTSGRTASMTITGSLAKVGSFAPDARSGYEWWLLESDPEHRIAVKGEARQVDSAESPIPRTEASSRLFLVQKGQRIEVSVQPLASLDVLAAVVRRHDRMMVLTRRGDVVTDDTLSYENNGIDYLLYAPSGRPIYLATDGKAERIMHQGEDAEEVLVPLQTGSHAVRAQALAQATLSMFGGSIELPMPSYPLTASRVSLTVGVPLGVAPVGLVGGDRDVWFADLGDVAAIAVGFVVGWLAVRPREGLAPGRARWLRVLGGGVLGGLWLLSPGLFVAVIVMLVAVLLVWVVSRFLRGSARVAVAIALLGSAGLVALIALSFGTARSPSREVSVATAYDQTRAPQGAATATGGKSMDRSGNFMAQDAEGGVLEGVTPVALTLPSYERSISVDRELVTRERPFRPRLVYLTEWALWPLVGLWLAGLVGVLAAHRAQLREAYARAKERLAQPDKPAAAPPAG